MNRIQGFPKKKGNNMGWMVFCLGVIPILILCLWHQQVSILPMWVGSFSSQATNVNVDLRWGTTKAWLFP